MQAVSEKWKENQSKPLTSDGYVEVVYTINDPDAKASAKGINPHELSPMPEGWNPPIVDETNHTVTPYATLEQNLWLLDGSKITPPNDGEYGYSGYISHNLCDESGSFDERPGVRVDFYEKVPILPGLIITWSTVFDDYPSRFRVTPYSEGTAFAPITVNDNTDTVSIVIFEMAGFDRADIEVLEWSTPYRRARIERIFFGFTKTYTKESLLDFADSRSIDPVSASLPKYEVSFEIDNRDGAFDPLNAEGLAKYMMERQEIRTRYGFKIGEDVEWIPGGAYYLSDWSAPQNGISASFRARDLLSFLSNTYFSGRFPSEAEPDGISLYTLALEVLKDANLPQRKTDTDYKSPWELDKEALSSFKTTAPLPICTFSQCLQMIANAACCTIYFDRDGILHIKRLDDSVHELTISERSSYARPEISLTKPVKQIDVSVYSFTREPVPSSIYEGTLPLNPGRNEFMLEFSNTADNVMIANIDDVTVDNAETKIYARSCKLVLYSNSSQTVEREIIITGNIRRASETLITTPNLPAGETMPLKNVLITNVSHAQKVGQWLRDNINHRKCLSLNWRTDPRIDAGDIITVGTQDVCIVTSNFKFSGAFKGAAEGVMK